MDYIKITFCVSPPVDYSDMLTFYLGEQNFEMFEETTQGIIAYIQAGKFARENLEPVIADLSAMGCVISFDEELIPWKNWNEEWEKNFQPEIISDRIYVRAEFHPPAPEYPIEIVVHPRMAFGTGHHATTSQMMEQMLLLDFSGTTVLDMGCGTGILAILAAKTGAAEVTAIDNDPNAVSITIENAQRNNCPGIIVLEGESAMIPGRYDILLANINRNIIQQDLKTYADALQNGGYLLTSGYYVDDLEHIRNDAGLNGLEYLHHSEKMNWCCALFYKP